MTVDLAVAGREAIADWVETTLLVRRGRQLGSDALHALALEEIGVARAQVELALAVMRRRASLLGASYPFQIWDWACRARPAADQTAYAALVLLTPLGPARQILHTSPTPEMAVLFERLTERAVATLWGPSGRALRFGWPSDIGRPPEFFSAIEWLARQMGLTVGAGYRPPRRKDGGVDVVGWRPFPDGRSGLPLMLVQCTLQADILNKARDIDRRLWATWLVLDDEPQVALAVPQTIANETEWSQMALHGTILERLRLTGLLAETLEPRVDGLHAWVTGALEDLEPRLRGGVV